MLVLPTHRRGGACEKSPWSAIIGAVMRRRLLIVLAACLPLLIVGWVGVLLTRSPSDESAVPTTSSSEASADVPIEATTGSPTAAAPPTPGPPYEPPPTKGSLAGSSDVLDAAMERARGEFEQHNGDPYPPRPDEVAVLFAGDVGPHRVIVAVNPAESTDLLWRVVLAGPAGAAVAELGLFGGGNDHVGSDEHAVVIGDSSGTVTVVAYPPVAGPVQVGAVPVGGNALVWQPAVDHGGWASAELTGVHPFYLVEQSDGTCGTTLQAYSSPDTPIDPVAIDAAIAAGCTAGMA